MKELLNEDEQLRLSTCKLEVERSALGNSGGYCLIVTGRMNFTISKKEKNDVPSCEKCGR